MGMLLPGESGEELKAFRAGMLARLDPQDQLEHLFADWVVAAAWRLRRAVCYEACVPQVQRTWADQGACATRRINDMCGVPHEAEELTEAEVAYRTLIDNAYANLIRYETHIERTLYRALHELQRLQAARSGQRVGPPPVADIDVNVAGSVAP